MRKLIAAINMTLDGFCDHTAMIADEEIHQHYNELLSNAGTLLYGRTTYQLMESYWPSVVKNPTGNKPMDEFAVLIDNISKIVFSRTWRRPFEYPGAQALFPSPSPKGRRENCFRIASLIEYV